MPVSEEEAVQTTLATFAMIESLRSGGWCRVGRDEAAPVPNSATGACAA